MSFNQVLNRLREAAKGQRGRHITCAVKCSDLQELINDFDRIDHEHRINFDRLEAAEAQLKKMRDKTPWQPLKTVPNNRLVLFAIQDEIHADIWHQRVGYRSENYGDIVVLNLGHDPKEKPKFWRELPQPPQNIQHENS